jgi:hypothetical protein
MIFVFGVWTLRPRLAGRLGGGLRVLLGDGLMASGAGKQSHVRPDRGGDLAERRRHAAAQSISYDRRRKGEWYVGSQFPGAHGGAQRGEGVLWSAGAPGGASLGRAAHARGACGQGLVPRKEAPHVDRAHTGGRRDRAARR